MSDDAATALRLRIAAGQISPGAAAVELALEVRDLVEELRSFAGGLEKAAGDLEATGGAAEKLSAAALQIAIARRIVEQALADTGEIFDVAVWLAGAAAAEGGDERPPG